MADDNYIPTLPTPEEVSEIETYERPQAVRQLHGDVKEYRLIISETKPVNPNRAEVIIRIRGADPKRWKDAREVRLVGTWESAEASTISHTGAGLFYFDGFGGAMLVGKPLTVTEGTESKDQVEEVMFLGGVRSFLRFVEEEGGYGKQYAQPCREGPCIQPGKIKWKCSSVVFIGRHRSPLSW
jgi:hypothetical protein